MFEGDWEAITTIAGIGVAAIGGTCALLIRHITADARSLESVRAAIANQQVMFARELTDFKLAATKEFVSVGHLLDVEARLVKHLDKIEALVDRALRIGETSERMDHANRRG